MTVIIVARQVDPTVDAVDTGPQFAWLEAATGAPMVAAMADMLAKGLT